MRWYARNDGVTRWMRLRLHLLSHNRYSCQCACLVTIPALGERNPQLRQRNLAVSTTLAKLGLLRRQYDTVFQGLEQLFAITGIAVIRF